jgi:hypothetical protein
LKIDGISLEGTLIVLVGSALCQQAYLKLVNREDIADADRERFLKIAARAMRRVLVDHARRRSRIARGRNLQVFPPVAPGRLVPFDA